MSTRAEREKLALLEEKRLEKEEKKRLLQEKRALRDAKKAEKMEMSTMNSSHVGESVENADEEGESGVNGGSREGGDDDEDEEEILSKALQRVTSAPLTRGTTNGKKPLQLTT